jgi:Secretion system C-terminal sorting domain
VQRVEVSPNPSNGEVHLRWHQPTTEDVWLNIFDAKGSPVMQLDLGQVASGEASRFIQISPELPNGFYFGRIGSNGGQGVATFVLER